MHPYERWKVRKYLTNALKTWNKNDGENYIEELDPWVRKYGSILGLLQFKKYQAVGRDSDINLCSRMRKEEWKKWRRETFASCNDAVPEISPLQIRLEWINRLFRLNKSQSFLLGVYARLAKVKAFRHLAIAMNSQPGGSSRFNYRELRPFFYARVEKEDFSNNGLLSRFGLLEDDIMGNYGISNLVDKMLSKRQLVERQVLELVLGDPAVARLSWSDFEHLGELRELAERLLMSDMEKFKTGINIIFYGDSGTGKSEFAKTLARRVGFNAHFLGEKNTDEHEPSRAERIGSMMIANALGAVNNKTLVVVDEADDLFAGVDEDNASTRHGSKIFMNRLVEKVSNPTVWIVNDIDRMGESVVRRMNLAIRFPRPSLGVRRNMVKRIADRASVSLPKLEVERLAHFSAAPALFENAIRSSALINGTGNDARIILQAGLKAMGQLDCESSVANLTFDPVLSAADVNLLELADRVGRAKSKSLSFCLSGPPGTGKTAYARYLAGKLGLEVLNKRYSDLISSYLGESEKAIARAFEEAADCRAFLLLDEADSLLRNRSSARNLWEISQVNEMLTCMERHAFPVACTTNAPELLDPATARRFIFKVRFLPMSQVQIADAFKRAFGFDAPGNLNRFMGVTPGDFVVVTRKAEALGETDPKRMERWLMEEVQSKPDGRQRRIGFWYFEPLWTISN